MSLFSQKEFNKQLLERLDRLIAAVQGLTRSTVLNTVSAPAPKSLPPKPLPLHGLMSLEQLVPYVGVSSATWRRGSKAGDMPAPRKIGRRLLWRVEDVRAYIDGDVPKRRGRPPRTHQETTQ